MKILITEGQLKNILLNEQGPMGLYGSQMFPGVKPGEVAITIKKMYEMYPHEINMVFGVATAFIPLVGPAISAGISLMDAKENVYELGLKYGYPYMSGGETVYLGNSSKYKFQMTPNGNMELKSQSTGNLGRWDNYKKVGDNGWTKEMYRRTYDSISSGKLD
jgi:hypothetical protein